MRKEEFYQAHDECIICHNSLIRSKQQGGREGGATCNRCKSGLDAFKCDIDTVRRALAYLEADYEAL